VVGEGSSRSKSIPGSSCCTGASEGFVSKGFVAGGGGSAGTAWEGAASGGGGCSAGTASGCTVVRGGFRAEDFEGFLDFLELFDLTVLAGAACALVAGTARREINRATTAVRNIASPRTGGTLPAQYAPTGAREHVR
jgi:hypothetical protein